MRVGFVDDAMSESGKISVLGSANIDSNIKIIIDARSGYNLVANGTKYHLVSGNSSSNVNAVSDQNISFSDSSPSGVFSILKFTSEAVNNSDLYLIANVLSASEVSTNANSQNIYNYIGNIGNSATGNLALFGQYLTKATSRQEVDSALKSAIPQADDGIRQNNLNNVNSSFASIENRLDQFGRYQIKEPVKVYRLKSGDEEEGKIETSQSNEISSPNKFGTWAQVITENSRQGAIQDTAGYDNNRNGLAFGFDKITESGSVLGLAFNLSNSNIKSRDNLKRTGVETYQISAYSRHLFSNDYFLDAMTSFAFNRYHSNRFIYPISTNADAKFNGQVYSAKIRSGFTKNLGSNFELTPDVSLTYAGGGNNSYNEEGAGTMNLKVSANNFDFLESRAGLKLGYKTKTKNGLVMIPQFKVSYGYDLIGGRQSVVSNFEGQSSSFITQYAKYDKSSLRIGFGINLYNLNSFKLSSEYNFEEKTRYKSHSAFVRGEYRF